MAVTKKQLKLLSKEIPYKWRVQNKAGNKFNCVAYVDARDVQNLFDESLGSENWQVNYKMVGTQMFAEIGVKVRNEDGTTEWIHKADGGTEANMEKEKALISDCFKRAAVAWSAGRFLYSKKIEHLKAGNYKGKDYPTTDSGTILWSGDEITEYITNRREGKTEPHSEDRYQQPASEPTYKGAVSYSKDTIQKAGSIEKEGKKGKECLKHFLPEYNKEKGKEYKSLTELNTDELLLDLIKFIEDKAPEGM